VEEHSNIHAIITIVLAWYEEISNFYTNCYNPIFDHFILIIIIILFTEKDKKMMMMIKKK